MGKNQTLTRAKELGAYYTPEGIARTLCRYAIQNKEDTILDPACGEGVFLKVAADRLLELDLAAPKLPDQINGIDLNRPALARATGVLQSLHPSFRWGRLIQENFFDFAEQNLGSIRFNAVVGNPPYIRYQKFREREQARALAEKVGVCLNGESASWAPFVALAASFVAPGGRLAMVLPREYRFVNYAKPLLEFLRTRFGRVLFTPVPGLPFEALQKVSLLYAEDGPRPTRSAPRAKAVDQSLDHCTPLARVARVRLGIVTGGKDFFVLRRGSKEAKALRAHLTPVVSSPSQLQGLKVRTRETIWLLNIRKPLDRALRDYIRQGEATGIDQRFKCRIRDPWYVVPRQEPPEAMLSYLCGDIPKIALNPIKAQSTNNVHAIWWKNRPKAWTLAFYNWLTLLTVERIGRVYGGGVLKIEPGDASRILIPCPRKSRPRFFQNVDRALRMGAWRDAVEAVSRWLLPEKILREARAEWKERRAQR